MAWTLRNTFLGLAVSATGLPACGGKVSDDNLVSTELGGNSGVANGTGGTTVTGGATATGGDSVLAGGAAPADGLKPIFQGDATAIAMGACASSTLPGDADASVQSCRLVHPQVQALCTSMIIDARVDQLSLLLTTVDVTQLLVDYTSPNCPLGNGYYLDAATNEFVLCPATCDFLQLGTAKAILYVHCDPLHSCIE